MLHLNEKFSRYRRGTGGRRSIFAARHIRTAAGSVMLALAPFTTALLDADSKVVFLPVAGSTIQVTGTSTLHGWSITSSTVQGKMVITGQVSELEKLFLQTPLPVSVFVQIPVSSLKSGEGGSMDETTHAALKAEAHPLITYRLTREMFTGRRGNLYLFDTEGVLNVAGRDGSIKMPVEVSVSDRGTVTVKGSLPLKMTDFNITPPTAILGTIRAGNDVQVSFLWTVQKQ